MFCNCVNSSVAFDVGGLPPNAIKAAVVPAPAKEAHPADASACSTHEVPSHSSVFPVLGEPGLVPKPSKAAVDVIDP